MGKVKHRFTVFLAGMLLCLIVLEVSLRIVGSIYSHVAESDKGAPSDVRNTILCIGDSVTFGIGAPRKLSYPAQLQKMMNKSEPDIKYTVINRGWPAQNSTQILMRLTGWLKEFKPNIVTILIGAQNQANFFGYRQYLEKSGNPEYSVLGYSYDWLNRIRIVKFLRLLFRDNKQMVQPPLATIAQQDPNTPKRVKNQDKKKITPECAQGFNYWSQGLYDKAIESIMSVIDKKEVEPDCYNMLGSIYREQKLDDEAIKWYKKGIEQDPGLFRNYEGIALTYRGQNQLEKVLFWLKKGFAHARYDTLYERCYFDISIAFRDAGDFRGAIEFFKQETQRQPLVDDYLHTLANDYMLMFKNDRISSEVHQWIEADIEQILELCRQFNVRVVLQNYPFEPGINHIYKRVAKRHDVPFVDHQSTFEKYIKDGVRSEEYFVPDGHPNVRGYHMMAENLWMIVKDEIE